MEELGGGQVGPTLHRRGDASGGSQAQFFLSPARPFERAGGSALPDFFLTLLVGGISLFCAYPALGEESK